MNTMRIPGAPRQWTYEDYASLPDDGNRYEVIDGEVYVTPASGIRHQRVARRVFLALHAYVEEHGLGELFWTIDLLFQTGQYFCPDLLFVPRAAADRLEERGMYGTPGLIVEILSPGSQRLDREIKSARYRDFAVPEYWVVDPAERLIERYRPGVQTPEVCRDALEWRPAPEVDALTIDVQALFGTA